MKFSGFSLIKSVLIHEYQHSSTRINMNQYKLTRINTVWHESIRFWHESTRVRHGSIRINAIPIQVNKSQHDSDKSQHESIRVQNKSRPQKYRRNTAKQNPNVTYEWCFPKNMWKTGSVNGLSFPIYFQLYHKELLFYKGIYFMKHCVNF